MPSEISDPELLKTLGELGLRDTRVIIGLDFGTTYSGIAWVQSNRTRVDDVEMINYWPKGPGISQKVPTSIAYADENRRLGLAEDQWGYAVRGGMKSYLWTKLLLDEASTQGKFDDKGLRDYFGSGLMKVPKGKTARDVCTDYMRHLYTFLCQYLEKKGIKLALTPLEVWITAPAIWSDEAKNATLQAAKSAGFGSRTMLGDSISVITEPEAASLTILKPKLDLSRIDMMAGQKKNFLVCDCGGGTVDIACYTILSVDGRPRFKELCVGMGAKCGSTAIDRRFDRWMKDTFGSDYTSVPKEARDPASKFMRSFETVKRNYRGHDDQSIFEVEPINMVDAPNSAHYNKDDLVVIITGEEMRSIIDPVIADVIQLVEEQVAEAWTKRKEKIEEIFLVGGFGDSEYLNLKMKQWCDQRSIQLTCPPHCQAAIATGAVLRGLFGLKPVSRVCRHHYGYNIGMPFREGIDNEDDAYLSEWEETKRCGTRIQWVAAKGETIDENTAASYDIWWNISDARNNYSASSTELDFYVSDMDEAPDSLKHWSVRKVGTVRVSFAADEIRSFETGTRRGRAITRFLCEVQVNMLADIGLIQFRTLVNGREAGYTAFEFEKDPTS